jgi:hypothetical protein
MTLTPPRKRDYALIPAVGVGAVASLTLIFGARFLTPPVYLASWFEMLLVLTVSALVTIAVYRWRIRRRKREPTAYTVRSKSAWSLEEDWRHQLGLWILGLMIGLVLLVMLRFAYSLGWLHFARAT